LKTYYNDAMTCRQGKT